MAHAQGESQTAPRVVRTRTHAMTRDGCPNTNGVLCRDAWRRLDGSLSAATRALHKRYTVHHADSEAISDRPRRCTRCTEALYGAALAACPPSTAATCNHPNADAPDDEHDGDHSYQDGDDRACRGSRPRRRAASRRCRHHAPLLRRPPTGGGVFVRSRDGRDHWGAAFPRCSRISVRRPGERTTPAACAPALAAALSADPVAVERLRDAVDDSPAVRLPRLRDHRAQSTEDALSSPFGWPEHCVRDPASPCRCSQAGRRSAGRASALTRQPGAVGVRARPGSAPT